ncbi:MAG: HAD hydrolase-like protein [Desulfurococcales archaeon]|nr:HAD hydrolase-like protein [Desulfurococcales archaeon]
MVSGSQEGTVRRPRLVIIDIDGTLINNPINWGELRERVKDVLGFPPPSKPLAYFIVELREKDNFAAWEVEKVVRQAEMDSIKTLSPDVALLDSIKALRNSGVRIALVTLRGKDSAISLLRKIRIIDYIDLLLTRDDVPSRHKQLFQCLQEFQVKPDEALFIGDTEGDEEAAKELGIPSVILPQSQGLSGVRKEVISVLQEVLRTGFTT